MKRRDLFFHFSLFLSTILFIVLAPGIARSTSFEGVSSGTIYQQADFIAVVRVTRSAPFSDPDAPCCYFTEGAVVHFQVEKKIKDSNNISEFDFTKYGSKDIEVGDRFLVFLKEFKDFGGNQGIYPIDKKGQVRFMYDTIIVPNLPMDRAVSLVNAILEIALEERTEGRIWELMLKHFGELDPYELFHESKPGWGIVTLQERPFPNKQRAFKKMIENAEDPYDRDKILSAFSKTQKGQVNEYISKKLIQEFEKKIYDSGILKLLDIDFTTSIDPKMELRIYVDYEGNVKYVEIDPAPGLHRKIWTIYRDQLSAGQQKVRDDMYSWKFETKSRIYVTLVARIDGSTIDNLHLSSWIDYGD